MALALFFAVEDGDDLLLGFAVMVASLMVNLKSEGLPLVFLTLPPLLWAVISSRLGLVN